MFCHIAKNIGNILTDLVTYRPPLVWIVNKMSV